MEKTDLHKEKPVIFFDGVCNLCDSFVNFVYKKDSQKQFLYAPLQGSTAEKLLPAKDRDSLTHIVFFYKGRALRGSRAVQEIFCRLYPRACWLFRKIPGRFLYNGIAKRRYQLFGKKSALYEPSPEQKKFFLP